MYGSEQTSMEIKWRQWWEENGTYRVDHHSDKPKYYVLTMFPYPSGAGLHVGHPLSYVAADIYARYKRLRGFNVMHPMGFDAFGLPAEQYAIETNRHPADTSAENIDTFKSQFEKIGFSYDWSREIRTCDPSYYRWTQYIFTELFNHWFDNDANKARPVSELIAAFETGGSTAVNAYHSQPEEFSAADWKGMSPAQKENVLQQYRLAYQDEAEVNWCEALGTVLANDEVKEGKSERGGHPVERRKMTQWFLRITAYAQRMLDQLEGLDWSSAMKDMQSNWIGRSEGASVFFPLENGSGRIEVFTTRPDTIFGATFMVLAPEHELVEGLITDAQRTAMEKYLAYAKSRTDVERQQVKEVTGCFTGSYAINPLNGAKVPVYIAEYVLAGYGTGAIMAVPSNDKRDQVFAEKFGIEIIEVVDQSMHPGADLEDKIGQMVNSDFLNGMEVMDAIRAIIDRIEAEGMGSGKINYRLRDAGFSRQRYWGEPFPIIHQPDGSMQALRPDQLPLELPEMKTFEPSKDGSAPLSRLTDWIELEDGSKREANTMPGYAGSSWYFLRYMSPDYDKGPVDPEAEAYWGQVDLYLGGAEHAVGHLMYARMWQHFLYDLGLVSAPEPFSKLVNQGMIQGRSSIVYRVNGSNTFVSAGLKDAHETTEIRVDIRMVENDVLDQDAFRNWRKDFADAEFILEDGRYICGYEVEKMSKRWHNVVNPDDVIAEYGADVFRMYEMFLGPIEDHKPWITKGIDGVAKFMKKFRRLFREGDDWLVNDDQPSPESLKSLHKCINKVQTDIERLSFNTCVSAFMIAVNELTEQNCHSRAILEPLVVLMSPFAVFNCEEYWQQLGNEGSVHHARFPEFKKEYVTEDEFEYPVSVNGKVRTRIKLPLDMEQADAQEHVLASEDMAKWLEGKELRKFIFVKGRIINVVV